MAVTRRLLSQVAAPGAEPLIVALAEAKLQARVTNTAEDGLITALLQTSREVLEARTGRAWLTQRLALSTDGFPDGRAPIVIPKPPLALSPAPVITYRDSAGVQQTWDASKYTVTAPAGPTAPAGLIAPAYGQCYPYTQCDRPDAVVVEFTCGVASPASLPGAFKSAILLLVAHLYANREAIVDGALGELPLGISSLLAPYELVSVV